MKIICLVLLQISTYSAQLSDFIQKILTEPKTENLNISVSIRNVSKEEETFAFNSKMAFPPASTLKLLTTGTSLDILGKDFKFQTKILTTGILKDGVLDGNLLIESNGDPSFGSKRLGLNPINQIIEFLKKSEIKTINGKIKIVGNSRNKIQEEWLVSDIGNYYGAFPSNFNYLENSFSVFFNGGKNIGDSTKIASTYPFSKDWKIINNVVSAEKGSGDNVNILNLPFSNEYMYSGTIPIDSKNFEIKGAISNIETIFINQLIDKLDSIKIQVQNQEISNNEFAKNLIGVISSPPLFDIALHTNHRSVNFFADGISNYLIKQAPDSLKSIDKFYKNYWQSKNLNIENFSFFDGSGLSTLNTFSTNSMTNFLAKMHQSKIFQDFLATIPIVGRSGSVASLDSKNISKGRIYAKSGSISGVRNYSGYFKDSKNQLHCFSVYLSGINANSQVFARHFIENLLLKMIEIDPS